MISSSSNGKSPETTNTNPSNFCNRKFRSLTYPFPCVSKVSIPLSSNTCFVSGEFGLVAAKTLEKQCESFNESITRKIICFSYYSNNFSGEGNPILDPLPPAMTSPIIMIQRLAKMRVLLVH